METTLKGKDVTIQLIPLVVAAELGKILGIAVVVIIFGVSVSIMWPTDALAARSRRADL